MPANGWELINKVSKPCLNFFVFVGLCKPLLLFELYVPKVKNGQKGFAELVDTQGQGSFDKNCLNFLRSENPRKRGKPSIESNNKRTEIPQQEIKTWQGKEKVVDKAKVGIQQDDKIARGPD